jgi:hypothetical protein
MSPFFANIRGDHLKENQKRLSDREVLRLPKNISIALGANAIHALGQNVYAGLLDEAEFGKQKSITSEEKSQIADLYHNVRRRMDSRFMQKGGSNPGILCLVSSAKDTENFLAKHVVTIKNDPRTYISQYALYDVKDEVFKDSARFRVVVGDKLNRSYILGKDEDESKVRAGANILRVPVEFYDAYERDIDTCIRDISGVETFGSRLFFPQRERILKIFEKATPRKHPFGQDEITLSLNDSIFIEDYFLHDMMVVLWDKTHMLYHPKYFPYADRYIHVDLAKNRDCAGMTMSCVSEMTLVDRISPSGMRVKARDYIHFIDFMIRIRAARGSEIDFAKIRQFVFFLIDTCKFKVRRVSYDSWQSTDSIQTFKKERLEAEEFSLDRKPGPYRTFRTILLEERLDCYSYEPFYDELTQLEDHTDEGGKVDHPVGGSKDVADSVAGSVCGSLLAKGDQITGTEAEKILDRAEQYREINKVVPALNPADRLKEEFVRRDVQNIHELDKLFNR